MGADQLAFHYEMMKEGADDDDEDEEEC